MFDKRKPHSLRGGKNIGITIEQNGKYYDGGGNFLTDKASLIPEGYAKFGTKSSTLIENNPLAKREASLDEIIKATENVEKQAPATGGKKKKG